MRPLIRPLAAASAAAYLLAGWLAAALHSHADHGHEAGTQAAACTTCSCGHHHHKPAKSERGKPAPAAPHEHDGCVVCEFLAKPPLAAAAVAFDATPGPVLPVVDPAPPALAPVEAPVSRSRGPPVA